MKVKFLSLLAITLLLAACGGSKQKMTPEQAKELAKEAYVYAFPAVEHNKALWKVLIFNKQPVNQFHLDARLFTPADTTVVSPNNDTYYCPFVLDIRNEPVVISIPKISNRYFCMQIIDIFTNCPHYVSTLATGDGPGNYLIVRDDWKGETPAGIDKVIKQSATVLLTVGRIQVFGHDDTEAAEVGNQIKVTPLSQFAKTETPQGEPLHWPEKPYDSKHGDIEGFFKMFNYMIQYQLLNETDKALLEKYAALGLGAGKEFKKENFTPEIWKAIEEGALEAKKEIEAKTSHIGKSVNGWDFSPENAGRWGTDYLTNAAAAWKYIYVNTSDEAIYPTANVDIDGKKLDGRTGKYTMTFTKEQLPHVKFFWSLTVYGEKGFFVPNPLNRYSLNSSSKLQYGRDGALTLFIQKDNPGKERESNWIPAPDGPFYMILRMYGPTNDPGIAGPQQIQAIVEQHSKNK